MHKFAWQSGQWYFVFLLKIRPWLSFVFQQYLQPSAAPVRSTGQCPLLLGVETGGEEGTPGFEIDLLKFSSALTFEV